MKIRLADRAKYQSDKMAKIALASTPRAQVDLYCLEPGQSQKVHAHDGQDKVYVVLEGRGTLEVEGESFEVTEGRALFVPAHAEHGFTGYESLSLLVIFTRPD